MTIIAIAVAEQNFKAYQQTPVYNWDSAHSKNVDTVAYFYIKHTSPGYYLKWFDPENTYQMYIGSLKPSISLISYCDEIIDGPVNTTFIYFSSYGVYSRNAFYAIGKEINLVYLNPIINHSEIEWYYLPVQAIPDNQ